LLFENGDSKVPVRVHLDINKSFTDISDLWYEWNIDNWK
jgi:hypothetical protein